MDNAHALTAILHQLFNPKAPTAGLIKHALESHKTYGSTFAENSNELWRILLLCANDWQGEIICVLDALDECKARSRQEIIEKLRGFYSIENSSAKLKFLVTGRPTTPLKDLFATMECYRRIDSEDTPDAIKRDIDKVIDFRVKEILSSVTQISERLKGVKNRTYLWLYLTLDVIEKKWKHSRVSDVEMVLNGLPIKVSQAYEKFLLRSTNAKRAEVLLQIILAAARPLTLEEANVALTLGIEKQWLSSHEALQGKLWGKTSFRSEVDNLCGLLINVYDERLFFIHQTAQKFLTGEGTEEEEEEIEEREWEDEGEGKEEERPPRDWKWKGRLSMSTSRSIISQACLHYLSLTGTLAISREDSLDVEDDITSLHNYSTDHGQHPFFSYAALNLSSHYVAQDLAVANETRKEARRLCRITDRQARLWIRHYLSEFRLLRDSDSWTDLALASFLDLVPVVKDILAEKNVDLNVQAGYYGTALQAASARGHSQMVELLPRKGADANVQGGRYGTALLAACAEGHKLIVQMLLCKNAEVNLRDYRDRTPLSIATQKGNTAIVKLLLKKAAEVDCGDLYGCTPLSWAAIYGHSDIVRLLLQNEKPAKVDSKDNMGYTSLSFAVSIGHQAIVHLLTEHSGGDASLTATSTSDRYAGDRRGFEDVFIAVVGSTGCGKSTFIKLLTGQDVLIGHSLEACTTDITDFSLFYRNFRIHLLDTPGIDELSLDVPTQLGSYLSENHAQLHGMIYLHTLRPRSRVGEEEYRALKTIIDRNRLPNYVIAITQWERAHPEQAFYNERTLVESAMFERLAFRRARKVFRHWNTKESALIIIDGILEQEGSMC